MEAATKKPRGKKKFLLICGVCLLLAAGAIFFALRSQSQKNALEIDDNALMGDLPGVDMEQRQAELQKQLDESMIAFSINTNPVFASGRSEGNLMLENPTHNAKLVVVEIYLDETNELIYRSKALPVGSYIENVALDKVLEPGEYAATAYFNAYRESDQSFVGQAGAAIKITILS